MQRKDVNEIIASTNLFLQNVIKVELERAGGSVDIKDKDCCHPAFDCDGWAKVNYFDKVFLDEDQDIVLVEYHDDDGKYTDNIGLFSIDELIETFNGM